MFTNGMSYSLFQYYTRTVKQCYKPMGNLSLREFFRGDKRYTPSKNSEKRAILSKKGLTFFLTW